MCKSTEKLLEIKSDPDKLLELVLGTKILEQQIYFGEKVRPEKRFFLANLIGSIVVSKEKSRQI